MAQRSLAAGISNVGSGAPGKQKVNDIEAATPRSPVQRRPAHGVGCSNVSSFVKGNATRIDEPQLRSFDQNSRAKRVTLKCRVRDATRTKPGEEVAESVMLAERRGGEDVDGLWLRGDACIHSGFCHPRENQEH